VPPASSACLQSVGLIGRCHIKRVGLIVWYRGLGLGSGVTVRVRGEGEGEVEGEGEGEG
jgi:hypothetical protein